MATRDEVDQEPSERRRWPRYHVTVPVRVTIQNLLQTSVINGLAFQMNDGGLEVSTDTELRIGDKADLKFKPPHFDRALTLRGVVATIKVISMAWSSWPKPRRTKSNWASSGRSWLGGMPAYSKRYLLWTANPFQPLFSLCRNLASGGPRGRACSCES